MKRKAGIFKFLWFKERSRKLRLRDRLVWAVGLTIEIKLCFLNSSSVVRTGFKVGTHKGTCCRDGEAGTSPFLCTHGTHVTRTVHKLVQT